MKTSNNDFLEQITKKAIEAANKLDVDEPPLVWPTQEEIENLRPKPKEGLVIPKKVMKQSSPKSYPIEQEVINQE